MLLSAALKEKAALTSSQPLVAGSNPARRVNFLKAEGP
jgi:hypothetical protein